MLSSFPAARTFSIKPAGGPFTIPRMSRTRLATSSMSSTPSAHAILRCVPKVLIRMGVLYPSTFSKSRAGPPEDIVRSAISVISRSRLTAVVTRLRSPFSSRKAINSRRSLNLIADYGVLPAILNLVDEVSSRNIDSGIAANISLNSEGMDMSFRFSKIPSFIRPATRKRQP